MCLKRQKSYQGSENGAKIWERKKANKSELSIQSSQVPVLKVEANTESLRKTLKLGVSCLEGPKLECRAYQKEWSTA